MYAVQFVSKRVEKELSKFDRKEQESISSALKLLKSDPRPAKLHFSALNRNSEIKRIKAKRARVFYKIDESKKIIYIGKIDNRDSKSYAMDPVRWFSA